MLAFTIIMIISYSICLFIGLTLKSFPKTEELKKEETTTQVGYVVIGCFGVIYVWAHLITYIIYLFNSLNVDVLHYPTWVMIGLFVLNLIVGDLKAAIRKMTKSEPKNKAGLYEYFTRTITYLYFVYMLYILIVGI